MSTKTETRVKANSFSNLSKNAVSFILAIALSLFLLPAPALAGDGGLGLAASTAGSLAVAALSAKESAGSSESSSADQPVSDNSAAMVSQQNGTSSSSAQTKTDDAASAPDAASANRLAGTENKSGSSSLVDQSVVASMPSPADSSSASLPSLAPAAVGTTFTDTIMIGGKPCACVFSVTGDTTAQIGNGTSPAVQLSVSGAVSIPDRVGVYTITGIGSGAFEDCSNITSTGLAAATHITSVGTLAFGYCTSLTDTGLAGNQSLVNVSAERIFEGCRLLTDTGLGSNTYLQSLSGSDVFGDCESLRSTGLATNKTLASIGDGSFGECTSLNDTGLGTNTSLVSMGDRAFAGCTRLSSTGLGTNTALTSLGANTFNGCTSLSETSLDANKTLTALGTNVFANCTALTSTGLESNQAVATLGGGAFKGCTALVHAAIGSAVASIGANCFDGDSKLADACFYGNWAPTGSSWLGLVPTLTVYYLSENAAWAGKTVTDVARSQDSLRPLSNLKITRGSISTPPSSYWAGVSGAAAGRYALGEKVSITETLSSGFLMWSSDDATGSFLDPMEASTTYTVGAPSSNTTNITALSKSFVGTISTGTGDQPCLYSIMADGTAQVGDGTGPAVNQTISGDIGIPPIVTYGGKTYTVTHVGDWAFSGCSSITSTGVRFTVQILSIGAYAYKDCADLQYTGLNDWVGWHSVARVKSIGAGAFDGCTSLQDTGLGRNLITALGDGAFENCSSLTSTELHYNTKLTTLGPETFKGCTALTDTGLVDNFSITSIGSRAFAGCTGIADTGLVYNGTVASIGDGAFAHTGISNAALDSAAITFGNKCFDGDDIRSVCFYGNVPPQDATWLGSRKSAGTPLSIYYLAEDAGWSGKTAEDLTGSAADSLKALSSLKITGGSILTQPSSYWSTLTSSLSAGRYAQGDKVSIAASNSTFLKWISDDASGSFKDLKAASTDYTVGAPASGTAKLTALSQSFDGTINVGGKDIPCTYVAAGDGTAQIGNGTDAAIEAGAAGKVILPPTVPYGQTVYTVNRIAESAFKNCTGITSTGLASNTSIKSIGSDAFKGCIRIASTGLSSTSTVDSMGSGVFAGCTALQDTGLAASANLKSMGGNAFAECTALTDTGLAGNTGLTAVDSGVFQGCTALGSTGLAINNHITSIGSSAFQGCSALDDTGLAFNSAVTSIGDRAFADTALSDVAIGRAAASFGAKCFDGDDVRSICFFGAVPPHDSSWLGTRKIVGNPIAVYYLSEHTGWSDETAADLTGSADDLLQALSYLSADATGSILTPASSYWAKLTGSATEHRYVQGDRVSIKASDPSAFLRWDSDDASGSFADATAAATDYMVGAPDSGSAKLTALSPRFSGSIRIGGKDTPCIYVASNDGTAQIGDGAATAVDQSVLGGIALPATVDYGGKTYAVKTIARQAFRGCSHIASTGLASNTAVTLIGDGAFSGCTALVATGLNSNSTVTSTGRDAFQDCTSLTDTGLAANGSLAAIGKSMFSGCTALTSTGLAANSSVVLVDDDAFDGCTSLENTGMGSNTSVVSLNGGAFKGCTSLSSTGLATNGHVTSVGQGAFQGCTALVDTGLASNAVVSMLGDRAFAGCTTLKDTGLASNAHVDMLGQGVFSGCSDLTDTGLGKNKKIASLGADAFQGCTALTGTGLETNGTIASLGDGAFKGCTALAHAAVGSGVTSLGQGCFDGDATLRDVCFYGSVPPAGPAWLGTPSAASVTVCYLAEKAAWARDGRAVLRPGDSLSALSHLAVDGGSAMSAPAGYWASVAGATWGRYAQGERVPVAASDPSAFLRWASDDPAGSFADASAASTAYTVGAPASGTAVLTVIPLAPVAPVTPDGGHGEVSEGLVPGSVLGSDTVTGGSAFSAPTPQSTEDWYSDPSRNGDSGTSSSSSGSTANFISIPPIAIAAAAVGAVAIAALIGLLLIRRRR